MTSKAPAILVVGADSLIGGALMLELETAGWPVMGTSRRREQADNVFQLDLADDMARWESLEPIDVAIICAGITGLNKCVDDPEGSRMVNVDGVSALAENFISKGSFVIYLSTNQVFDGAAPYPSPGDPTSPITEYGRQKAEAERRIMALKDKAAILRMTKVLGEHNKLFETWLTLLKKGEPITPFSDINFSPVPLGFVVSALKRMVDVQTPGLFHLSGEKDVSYEYAARMGGEIVGADEGLILPATSQSLGAYTEPQPKNTALDIASFVSFYGGAPPPVDWTLRAAFTGAIALRHKIRSATREQ